MAKSAAERQKNARDRRAAREQRKDDALLQIIELLKKSDKPLAVRVRELAQNALKPCTPPPNSL